VLVVAVEGRPDLGWWGEVLTTAAEARGITGLVIDACVRDTAAIAAHRFPVFAIGIALPGAAKEGGGVVGGPVSIGGAVVNTGDQVVADADGVVVIPGRAHDEVVAAGRARQAKEAAYFAELRDGRTTVELLGLDATRVVRA
jgi:4-hydroxy-4-methyl-2-oxoglutarate aldolase